MGVYGVDYPATTDFPTAMAGIYDADGNSCECFRPLSGFWV
ncbi:cutinase cut1 [Mycobacterium tuberculosis]|nr:cutinase cut1 [Mycobacterium tuberculosis]